MKSVDGDEYLISAFLKVYEEIKSMGHDLMYRIISTSAENPDIELEDILKKSTRMKLKDNFRF